MINLFEIISNGANVKLEISSEDLKNFCNDLINRAKKELGAMVYKEDNERLITREEVRQMCGVCDATLWHWNRKGYLKTIKVGNKVRYRLSDVRYVLGQPRMTEEE